MENLKSIEKACGFYVSNMHLVTKILPFVGKKIESGFNVITFLEYNLKENIKLVLDKTIINEEIKNNILKVDWNNTSSYKSLIIDKKLKATFNENKNIILISGSQKYIDKINVAINNRYQKKSQRCRTLIINCYEVSEFNNDIREILDAHDLILNTSGIKKIEDVFEGYEKKTANY